MDLPCGLNVHRLHEAGSCVVDSTEHKLWMIQNQIQHSNDDIILTYSWNSTVPEYCTNCWSFEDLLCQWERSPLWIYDCCFFRCTHLQWHKVSHLQCEFACYAHFSTFLASSTIIALTMWAFLPSISTDIKFKCFSVETHRQCNWAWHFMENVAWRLNFRHSRSFTHWNCSFEKSILQNFYHKISSHHSHYNDMLGHFWLNACYSSTKWNSSRRHRFRCNEHTDGETLND